MPFAYFGAKHGLARKYPRPAHDLIIEPFAGAAGYSCYHAALGKQVLLNDLNADVVALWRRLQNMTPADLDVVANRLGDTRTDDLLIASAGGSTSWNGVVTAGSRQVTPRMRSDVPSILRRIGRVLPVLHDWEIRSGDYRDLPDVEATWFIDPPYQPLVSMAGNGYTNGADGIDYDELGVWCQSRRGQVIVCEQSPAQWLPFSHLAHQQTGSANGQSRLEVMWTTDYQQQQLWGADK